MKMKDKKTNPKRILILSFPGIGDTLNFTPALRLLRKHYPQSEIDVVTIDKGANEGLKNNQNITNLIFHKFSRKNYFKGFLSSAKLMFNLRKKRYDLCIVPYPANKLEYSITAFLTGAKKRIAHNYPIKRFVSFSWLYNKKIPIKPNLHSIYQNINLLKTLGIKEKNPDTKINFLIPKQDTRFAKQFFKQLKIRNKKPVIAFHPGSSTQVGMTLKRWPKEYFAELIDLIKEKYPIATILLFGGSEEQRLKEKIASLAKSRPILVNTPTIKKAAAILKQCDLLVTNDTALMHIAAAVGTPTITITGPTNPNRTIPLGKKHKTILAHLPCQPCYEIGETIKCRFKGKNKIKCLKLITPAQVFKLVDSLLSKTTK